MSEDMTPAERRERRLASDLRQLAQEGLEPARDLWPELEIELRRQRRRAWPRLAAAAALVGLAVVSTWWLVNGPSQSELEPMAYVRSSPSQRTVGATEHGPTFERYVETRREILESISAALADYPPELRRDIRRSVQGIAAAMEDIERAIEERPGAADRTTELAELYAQEIRLLGLARDRLLGYAPEGGAG